MTILRDIAELLARWLDSVAAAIVSAVGWIVSPRVVRIVEEDDGSAFTMRGPKGEGGKAFQLVSSNLVRGLPAEVIKAVKGNRVELVLRPSRFVLRPLELPRRAVEFLDGIVRAQIDRLTPWPATEAVFGWGRPSEIASDRISIMVAATARATVRPFLQAVSKLGAASVAILTAPADGPAAAIKVYEQSVHAMLDAKRVRRLLTAVLVVAVAAASVSMLADVVVGGDLEARQLDLARRVNERRLLLRGGQDVTRSATALLDRRKQDTPATVIVLEVLSDILPDHTYVTEMRVEGNKLQIIGVTRDAPGLIRLIEQSPHFKRATFFAPTTRSPSDPGERFHIEARIEPVNTAPRS